MMQKNPNTMHTFPATIFSCFSSKTLQIIIHLQGCCSNKQFLFRENVLRHGLDILQISGFPQNHLVVC